MASSDLGLLHITLPVRVLVSDRAWFLVPAALVWAESITHATYSRPESVPGPHSVRQSVYEKNGLKLQVATCTSLFCVSGL